MSLFKFKSIRSLLLVKMSLLAIIPLIAISFFNYQYFKNSSLSTTKQNQQSLTTSVRTAVNLYFFQALELGEQWIKQSDFFVQYLNNDVASMATVTTYLNQVFSESYLFRAFIITDYKGTIMDFISEDGLVSEFKGLSLSGINLSDIKEGLYISAYREGFGLDGSYAGVMMSLPLYDDKGRVMYLHALVDLAGVHDFLDEKKLEFHKQGFSDTQLLLFNERTQHVLYFTDDTFESAFTFDRQKIRTNRFFKLDGMTWNAAVEKVPFGPNNFELICFVSKQNMMASPYKMLAMTLMILAGALVVIVLTIIRVSRSFTIPIEAIGEKLNRVANWDFKGELSIEAGQEFGRLAKDANEMTTMLRKSNRSIQRQKTLLRQAKDLAEDSNKSKSSFLANMSHELRTPLNAILGYSEIIKEDAIDDANDMLVEDVMKIHHAGSHLLELINSILDLSKIEAGKLELYCETIQLPQLVASVESIAKPLMSKKSNQLKVLMSKRITRIVNDHTKLRQILFNLLSNAAKFTEKGTVTLDIKSKKVDKVDHLVIKVKDTGIGMSQEQCDKIFKPFEQADKSTTRQFGGTGLGLTITKKFCEMMGGSIHVESTEGKGTCFEIIIPKNVVEDDSHDDVKNSDNKKKTWRLMVVDDDKTVHELIKRVLERHAPDEYRLFSVKSGQECLDKISKIKPDMVTLDVMMPGKYDGWAVLKQLREQKQFESLPIIMLSIIKDKNMGMALGATDYLAKPLKKEIFLKTLRKYRN